MLEKPFLKIQELKDITEAEKDQRQPRPIRGHHLFAVQEAISVLGPRITARKHTAVILGDEPAWVIKDMIAPDDKDGIKFTESLASALQSFIELPDDYPVNVVTGQPDFICALCAIGSHCNKLRQDNGQGDIVAHDEIYLNRFINTADSLGISLNIMKKKKSFDDLEDTLEVTTIKTNKGNVIKILEQTDLT